MVHESLMVTVVLLRQTHSMVCHTAGLSVIWWHHRCICTNVSPLRCWWISALNDWKQIMNNTRVYHLCERIHYVYIIYKLKYIYIYTYIYNYNYIYIYTFDTLHDIILFVQPESIAANRGSTCSTCSNGDAWSPKAGNSWNEVRWFLMWLCQAWFLKSLKISKSPQVARLKQYRL